MTQAQLPVQNKLQYTIYWNYSDVWYNEEH